MHEPPCCVLLTISYVTSFTVVGCVLVEVYTLPIPSRGIIRIWSLIFWCQFLLKESIDHEDIMECLELFSIKAEVRFLVFKL